MKRTCTAFMIILMLAGANQAPAQSGEWSTPVRISHDTIYAPSYPSIAVGRDGKIFVVWMCRNQPPSGYKAQIFLASYDGKEWLHEVAITDTGFEDWTPDVGLDTLGNPHIVWEHSYQIYYQSFDGISWSLPIKVSQDGGPTFAPRIGFDHNNKMHFVWHVDTDSGAAVYYRSSDGSVWSPQYRVSDTLVDAAYPRIAVDSKGNVHTTFHALSPPTSNGLIYARSCIDGQWTPISTLTSDSVDAIFPDIAVKSDDSPVIVWGNRSLATPFPYRINIYTSAFEGSGWSPPAPIADTSESREPSITIDRSGRLHVVWDLYYRTQRTHVIMYNTSAAGLWSVPLDISTPIPTWGRPMIRVDDAGGCHVVWLSNDYGRVYYRYHAPVTSVDEFRAEQVGLFSLSQNYPNPFNSRTTITYTVPRLGWTRLTVVDLLGRTIRTLMDCQQMPGVYSVTFEAAGLPSGIYFYRLQANGRALTRRMLYVR